MLFWWRRKPRIVALGCCRIDKPLLKAHKAGLVNYIQPKLYKYIHNSAEILQTIGIIRRCTPHPAHLTSLMSLTKRCQQLAKTDKYRRRFLNADAYVVEISSLRTCAYQGWQMQMYRLQTMFAPLLSPQSFSRLYKDPGQCRAELDSSRLENDLDRDIWAHADFHQQSADDLAHDLDRIVAELGKPIIFVGYMAHDRQGNPIPQRALIRDTLRAAAQRHPQTSFFDPTPHVEAHGYAQSFIEPGHYLPAFEPLIGQALAAHIDGFLPKQNSKNNNDKI